MLLCATLRLVAVERHVIHELVDEQLRQQADIGQALLKHCPLGQHQAQDLARAVLTKPFKSRASSTTLLRHEANTRQ